MPPDTPEYLRHYREILDAKGAGFEATGWRNPAFQTQRFRVFTQLQPFDNRTVLDAGAGRADFAAHLLEHGYRFKSFTAMDAMAEMVDLVRQRNLPDVHAVCADFAGDQDAFTAVEAHDVVVFSGSLNTLDEDDAVEVLDRAWLACTEALLFNFLSDRCPEPMRTKDTGPARRFNTLRFLDWALTRTPLVTFRQDYLDGHDATIAMFRG